MTDTARGQIHGHGRTETTHPDHENPGVQESLLTLDIDSRQHDLPAVTQKLFVLHIGEL